MQKNQGQNALVYSLFYTCLYKWERCHGNNQNCHGKLVE